MRRFASGVRPDLWPSKRRGPSATRGGVAGGPLAGQAAALGVEVVLDRVGALDRGQAGKHRLEGALCVQPRQSACAPVGHLITVLRSAGAVAGATDDNRARPAIDGPGEGTRVVGLGGPVSVEDLAARCDARAVEQTREVHHLDTIDDGVPADVRDARDFDGSGEAAGPGCQGWRVGACGRQEQGQ